MNNRFQAIEKVMEFVRIVRNALFVHIRNEDIKAVLDDEPHIVFGSYLLTPVYTDTPSIRGTIKKEEWRLTSVCHYGGACEGEPPYDEEKDEGTFPNIQECLIHIGKLETQMVVHGIAREIEEREAAKHDYDENVPTRTTCPHGNVAHECNDCMVASDIAYDSMRERR